MRTAKLRRYDVPYRWDAKANAWEASVRSNVDMVWDVRTAQTTNIQGVDVGPHFVPTCASLELHGCSATEVREFSLFVQPDERFSFQAELARRHDQLGHASQVHQCGCLRY